MTHALNLTLPIKQDPATQQKLQELKDVFETKVQPVIETALKRSRIVHFARVVVIDNKYQEKSDTSVRRNFCPRGWRPPT